MQEKPDNQSSDKSRLFKKNIINGNCNTKSKDDFLPLVVCCERKFINSIIGSACVEPYRTHNQNIYRMLHKYINNNKDIIDVFNITYGLCITFVHLREPHNIFKELIYKVESFLRSYYISCHSMQDEVEQLDEQIRHFKMESYIVSMSLAIFGATYYLLYIQEEKSFELKLMLEEMADDVSGISGHVSGMSSFPAHIEEACDKNNSFYSLLKIAHEYGERECMSFDIWRKDLHDLPKSYLQYITHSYNVDIVNMLLAMPETKLAQMKLADRIVDCIRDYFVKLYMSEPEEDYMIHFNNENLQYIIDTYGDGKLGTFNPANYQGSLTEEDYIGILSQKLNLPASIIKYIEKGYYNPVPWGLPGLLKNNKDTDENSDVVEENNTPKAKTANVNQQEEIATFASIEDIKGFLLPKIKVLSGGQIAEFDYNKDKLIEEIKPEAVGWANNYNKAAIGLAAFNSAGLLPKLPNIKFVKFVIRHSVALTEKQIKSIAAQIGAKYKKMGEFSPTEHKTDKMNKPNDVEYFNKIYMTIILGKIQR